MNKKPKFRSDAIHKWVKLIVETWFTYLKMNE